MIRIGAFLAAVGADTTQHDIKLLDLKAFRH